MRLEGPTARSEQFMDEDGTILRDKVRIRERWGGYFQTVLNKKSPKLDPTISALFLQRPLIPSLGDEPTMDDMTGGNPGYAELESGRTRLPPS